MSSNRTSEPLAELCQSSRVLRIVNNLKLRTLGLRLRCPKTLPIRGAQTTDSTGARSEEIAAHKRMILGRYASAGSGSPPRRDLELERSIVSP
jgi:hypothetical protein